MAGQVEMVAGRSRRNDTRGTRTSKTIWRKGILAGLLVGMMAAAVSAEADEFDPLVAYEAARPLNDHWQACAASFAKRRLRTKQSSVRIAAAALAHCSSQEERLRHFLAGKIGQRSARASVGLLHERYLSDLSAAVDTLRARK